MAEQENGGVLVAPTDNLSKIVGFNSKKKAGWKKLLTRAARLTRVVGGKSPASIPQLRESKIGRVGGRRTKKKKKTRRRGGIQGIGQVGG